MLLQFMIIYLISFNLLVILLHTLKKILIVYFVTIENRILHETCVRGRDIVINFDFVSGISQES